MTDSDDLLELSFYSISFEIKSVSLMKNIIYKISDSSNLPITVTHLEEINSIVAGHNYIDRLVRIIELGYKVEFSSFEDSTFKLNLEIIDSNLPKIVAHIVLEMYQYKITKITEVITRLNECNPMNYDQTQGHNFYEYKIMRFLMETTLNGSSESFGSEGYRLLGGILLVKSDSILFRYEPYDLNKFRDYLKNSSRLDSPSGSKMGYGFVYKENDESFIKLNFQVKA